MTRNLLGTNLIINQSNNSFSLDTILLSSFCHPRLTTNNILDIGTGIGTIPLYLSTKTNAKIVGVEIQESLSNEAVCNVYLNHLNKQIEIINGDITHVYRELPKFDLIVCNPPYFKTTHLSFMNKNNSKSVIRHEDILSLISLFCVSNYLLKNRGQLFIIHRANRLEEIIDIAKNNDFAVKTMCFIHSYLHSEAKHVLLEFQKNANIGLKVLPPIILYQSKHVFSNRLKLIYENINNFYII